jgi:hypothetical protein
MMATWVRMTTLLGDYSKLLSLGFRLHFFQHATAGLCDDWLMCAITAQ